MSSNEWDSDLEASLYADRGLSSLEFFCREIIGLDNPANPKAGWWDDKVHGWLCRWLQPRIETWIAARKKRTGGRTYLACVIPRGCGKSEIITKCTQMWIHLKDPNISTYLGNEALDLAEDFLSAIKGHLDGSDKFSKFVWCYGNWRTVGKRWREDVVVHGARQMDRRDPSFGTYSPTSGLTGRHPDVIVMDDLVSYDALKKDTNWFAYAYSVMTDLIPVCEPNGLVILVGTRYGDGDPFGRCFDAEADGIASVDGHSHGPYEVTPGGIWHVFFLDAELPDGSPAIPTCWSKSELERYKKKDRVKYASQLRNDPKAHGLRQITEPQFNECIVTQIPAQLSIVFSLDTAFRNVQRLADNSETVMAVSGHLLDRPGTVWGLDYHHSTRWRAEHLADLIIKEHRKWTALGHTIIAITDENEPGGKDGSWEALLANYYADANLSMPSFVGFSRQKGEAKDVRISKAIDFVVAGHVKLYREAIGLTELRGQICNHPYAARKDIADAFADVFMPEFYNHRLPGLKPVAAELHHGGWESSTKGKSWYMDRDTMNSQFDRAPLGRSGRKAAR